MDNKEKYKQHFLNTMHTIHKSSLNRKISLYSLKTQTIIISLVIHFNQAKRT